MPKATKECRVCGKTYVACNTNRHFDGSFHWREVACSPECGQEYLKRVTASRIGQQDEPEIIEDDEPEIIKKDEPDTMLFFFNDDIDE